jgi:hypothetical protein
MLDLTDGKKIQHDDDPQKDLWGGEAEPKGRDRRLSAVVRTVPGEKKWFQIRLKVESSKESNPLTGKVTFYLHDSFDEPVITVRVRNGAAILTVVAIGAFTVGAKVEEDNGTVTELELDLAYVEEAPLAFREN